MLGRGAQPRGSMMSSVGGRSGASASIHAQGGGQGRHAGAAAAVPPTDRRRCRHTPTAAVWDTTAGVMVARCAWGTSARRPAARRAVPRVAAYLAAGPTAATADTLAAFKRLQNGSDIRGVALQGEVHPHTSGRPRRPCCLLTCLFDGGRRADSDLAPCRPNAPQPTPRTW
jgi:hypothetical protein